MFIVFEDDTFFTDNRLLNLFLLDGNSSLLENMVAINLLRKYGRNDAVYFYNRGIEVIPVWKWLLNL